MPVETCQKYTGALSEILALTPVVQTIADATDVPGVRLEWMNGAWYGDCGFPSAAQHSALIAANAYNSLALGAKATLPSGPVTWRGVAGGWAVPAHSCLSVLRRGGGITFIGDSITAGAGSGATPINSGSWANKSMSLLRTQGRAVVQSGLVVPTTYLVGSIDNAQWTLGANWVKTPYGAGSNAAYKVIATGSNLTYTPNTTIPYNEIHLLVAANATHGTLTITPSDGTQPITVNCAAIGSTMIRRIVVKLNTMSTTTSLSISMTSGTMNFVLGAQCRNTEAGYGYFNNLGVGSTKASGDWDKSGAFYALDFINSTASDKNVIMLGRNDINGGVSSSSFASALTVIVKAAKLYGDVILCTIPPGGNAQALANDADFRYVTKEVARITGCSIVDFSKEIFNDAYTPSMMSDIYHPNQSTHTLMAEYFADLISGGLA